MSCAAGQTSISQVAGNSSGRGACDITQPQCVASGLGVTMSYASKRYDFRDQGADYARWAQQLGALLARERDLIANTRSEATG